MTYVNLAATIAELAQLRERAKAACEEARRLRHEREATLEHLQARMRTIRASKEEFRLFLRQLRSDTGCWRCSPTSDLARGGGGGGGE